MNKVVLIDPKASKELDRFNKQVQDEFVALIEKLGRDGLIKEPDGKKIDSDICEMRVRLGDQYRGLYVYLKGNEIIILTFFKKTTPSDMRRAINLAKQRRKGY